MANVELRIMPNGEDGRWYWEVIKNGREVVARGVKRSVVKTSRPHAAQSEAEASQQWAPVQRPRKH